MNKIGILIISLMLFACTRSEDNISKSAKIVIYGDSQSNHKIHKQICKLICLLKPDAVIHVGDIVENPDDTTEWVAFNNESMQYRKKYPFYAVVGNHDINYTNFLKYIDTPNGDTYYSKEISDLHFIFLDSNDDLKKGSIQYNWLVTDLKNVKNNLHSRAIIVVFHHPPFGCDKEGNDGDEKNLCESIVPLFDKYGVNIVFSGHNHLYERIKHKNTWYIITGGGGGEIHKRTRDCHKSEISISEHHLCELVYCDNLLRLKVYLLGKHKIEDINIDLDEKN